MAGMRKAVLLVALAGLSAGQSAGQNSGVLRAESARIGPDHRVYVRWTGRPERVQALGEEQADTEDLKVAPDRAAVGWLVGRTDLSDASYPEPFELMVAWNGGRPHGIFPGRVIGEWRFADDGKRVVVWDETGHGARFGKASLYGVRTGKLQATWSPDAKTTPPMWAAPLHAWWDSDGR